MNLTNDHEKFVELLEDYDIYESTLCLTRDGIPEGARLSVRCSGDDRLHVEVFRIYPFNDAVRAARKDMIAYSNQRSDASPTVKFHIDGWTPEKLADMQAKLAERTAKQADLARKHREAANVYNDALEAQRLEILTRGEPT